VGIELYQAMLEEAVASLRTGEAGESREAWSPQINLGAPVLIPDEYVADLNVRMSLYRRLAEIEGKSDIDAFAAELIDRFGPIPEEVENLLKIVTIKQLCHAAQVAKIDAGPKGATITFRDNSFPNPSALIAFITEDHETMRVRPDHTLVVIRNWPEPEQRLKGIDRLLTHLAEIAEESPAERSAG
jgi:transcription-repair coupling factor (superfamily II helicase)